MLVYIPAISFDVYIFTWMKNYILALLLDIIVFATVIYHLKLIRGNRLTKKLVIILRVLYLTVIIINIKFTARVERLGMADDGSVIFSDFIGVVFNVKGYLNTLLLLICSWVILVSMSKSQAIK